MTSPNQPDRATALGTAQDLTGALNGMSQRLDAVKKYGRRTRVLFWVDVVLTLALAGMGFWVSSASDRASSADASAVAANARAAAATAVEQAQHEADISACKSGNQYRAGVVSSLDRLVVLLEGPHPSPVVQKAAKSYEAYVLSQNMPRDCQKAYAITPPSAAPKEINGTR